MEESRVETFLPWELPFEELQEKLMLEEEEDIALMRGKYREAAAIARPKAIWRPCYVDGVDGDAVTIGGITFHSEVMAKNLQNIHRVFAYVITCGTEVDEWSHQEKDPIVGLWLDILKEQIMRDARTRFFTRLGLELGISKYGTMSPGSGNEDTWPIQQQPLLFQLLDDVTGEVGVRLTESFLMLPTKSVSGILFPSEVDFITCSLCRRENCVGRRAPYTGDM